MSSLSIDEIENDDLKRIIGAQDLELEQIIRSVFRRSEELGDVLLPVRIGIRLRNSGNLIFAEKVFRAGMDADCRASALYELGVLKSLQGEVDQAVLYLETRLREAGLEPHEKIFLARQYARQGRLNRAEVLLEEAAALEPQLRHECLVSYQSFKFVNRFDKRITLGLLEEVKSIFRVYVQETEVEERIAEALSIEEPFLLLRMGDGEGSVLRPSIEDECKYNLLYRDNLEEFTEFWFNERSIAIDPRFAEVITEFNGVPFEADVIGTFHIAGIDNEYNIGSRRGIAWAVNTLRVLLNIARLYPLKAPRIMVGDPNIHYNLFASGALDRLLADRPRVGLISCHPGLASALKQKYNIGEMEYIKIPAEQVHADVVGEDAAEGIHWPNRYHEVRSIIAGKKYNGYLFLVAAGMLGKIYARDLKRAGAVVLDIGSIADALVGKNTRTFPQNVKDRMVV
jgi:hypothetical protein